MSLIVFQNSDIPLNFGFTPTRPVGLGPPPLHESHNHFAVRNFLITLLVHFFLSSLLQLLRLFLRNLVLPLQCYLTFFTHVSLKTAQKCDFCIQSQGIIPPKIRFQSPLLCDLEQKICLHA